MYTFFTVSGLILLKIGGETFVLTFEYGKMNLCMSWQFILGFIAYVTSFVLWIVLLQKFNLSYMYPILVGLAYIFVLLASIIILKEKVTNFNIAGSVIILVGILFMNIK
ncbi:MAG: hypothetical protein A2Y24_07150 [Clostridiales bacterium GWE2_32_10]|nr:MAG: hypothetical protein A2Y24_07150 [Clostridiales bacterium GWE2_32_10]